MASTKLTQTKISDTYGGVLHSNGEALPVSTQADIYDGLGNKSSLKLGRACNGATVCGTFTCDILSAGNISSPGNLTISNSSPYISLIETDAPKTWYIVADNSTLSIRKDTLVSSPYPLSISSTGNTTLGGSLSVTSSTTLGSNLTVRSTISALGTVSGDEPTLDTHLTTKKYVDGKSVKYKEYRLWTNSSAPNDICSYQVAHDVVNFTHYAIFLKRVAAANTPIPYPSIGTYIDVTGWGSAYLTNSYISSDRFVVGRATSGNQSIMLNDVRLYSNVSSLPGFMATSTRIDVLFTNTDWQLVVRIYY
jgi:hypothetical protein